MVDIPSPLCGSIVKYNCQVLCDVLLHHVNSGLGICGAIPKSVESMGSFRQNICSENLNCLRYSVLTVINTFKSLTAFLSLPKIHQFSIFLFVIDS